MCRGIIINDAFEDFIGYSTKDPLHYKGIKFLPEIIIRSCFCRGWAAINVVCNFVGGDMKVEQLNPVRIGYIRAI
ncbi:hypothetical protein HanRHA438_Chr08g0366431 [Helianthus annuus]|nr:hypothetical protein HanRHA438_Chr08g0366431 [Helianthus annuus]